MKRSSRLLVTLFVFASGSMLARDASAGLLIVGNFIGGEQKGPSFGGGNIVDIFEAAASAWESVIRDDFTLRIDYGWGPDPGGYHYLGEQGGDPNRETAGTILVNPQIFNDGTFAPLYMDATPLDNAEFTSYQETAQDFGGGMLNTGRILQMNVEGVPFYLDLYTIVSHEIGHALGLSNANASFITEGADGDIDVTGSQPFAGSVIPLATNNFGVTSHLAVNGAVMTGLFANGRQLLSDADILANAQLSGWHTTLEPEPSPEPAALWLMGSAIAALAGGERRRRKRSRPDA
jgi:hypothetical protein